MAGEPHTRRLLAGFSPSLAEVARTADPDQALNRERLFRWASIARHCSISAASPRMLGLLCTIFENSDSLAFALIRDPMLVYWLAEEDVLTTAPTREDGCAALPESRLAQSHRN